jgi:hypothetical protein
MISQQSLFSTEGFVGVAILKKETLDNSFFGTYSADYNT